jgi:PBP1b-binding outer membrane lipoprotein LpoB
MKKFLLLAPVALAAVLFAGCGDCCSSGGSDSGPAATSPKFDTAAIEQAFASAEQGVKTTADKAIAAVKNADYASALTEAQKLLNDVKLTPQQKAALGKLVDQVKSAAGDAAAQAAEAVKKAAADAKAALPAGK